MATRFNADQGGKFLPRYLEQHYGRIITEYTPAMSFADGSLIPTTEDLEIGVGTTIYEQVQIVDQTGSDGEGLENAPVVSYVVSEHRQPVLLTRRSFNLPYETLKRHHVAMSNGSKVSVIETLFASAVSGLATDSNRLAAYGRQGFSTGLLNDPNVTPLSVAFNPYNPAASSDDIYDFITTAINQVIETQSIEDLGTDEMAPDTIIFPLRMQKILIQNKVQNTAINLINQLQADYPNITRIKFTGLASGASRANFSNGVATVDQITAYKRSPLVLHRQVSIVDAPPPGYNGAAYKQFLCQAVGQVAITQPKFVSYVEFPNV